MARYLSHNLFIVFRLLAAHFINGTMIGKCA